MISFQLLLLSTYSKSSAGLGTLHTLILILKVTLQERSYYLIFTNKESKLNKINKHMYGDKEYMGTLCPFA